MVELKSMTKEYSTRKINIGFGFNPQEVFTNKHIQHFKEEYGVGKYDYQSLQYITQLLSKLDLTKTSEIEQAFTTYDVKACVIDLTNPHTAYFGPQFGLAINRINRVINTDSPRFITEKSAYTRLAQAIRLGLFNFYPEQAELLDTIHLNDTAAFLNYIDNEFWPRMRRFEYFTQIALET